MRILLDYLRQTGDLTFLDHEEKGATVFEWMKRMGRELVKRYARPDGLLDFGAGSDKTIEMRTDGYQHVVAAMNGMSLTYFRQLAVWARQRQDPEATHFEQWANQLHTAMNEKLWNEQAGWFDNLYPDGSRHLVWSYHLFDVLDGGFLSEAQQRRLVSHIVEGEFLGPYGMYSVSKSDRVHWDLEDVDWGGGGQYAGAPLRIAELLYRLGYGELGWNVLSRCTRWVDKFPYIPQEIFADFPGNPAVEMPLEISAGSGVQAILFGTFGLRPTIQGTLEISPTYHQELGKASLVGYRFRGQTYDVRMDPWGFEVFKNGMLVARNPHGTAMKLPRP
jgi:glycogen debranching enzyme